MLIINLANTVSSLIEKCSVNETEISRQTNLPRATIYRLKGGLVDPRLSTLKTLADFFKVSLDQLIGEKEIFFLNEGESRQSVKIPLVQWDVATLKQTEKNNFLKTDFIFYEIDHADDENHYVALKTFSDAMSPNFPPNTTVIVDKNRVPKNQDYVIAKTKGGQDAVLRRLLLEGETKILQATNSVFPTINLSTEDSIMGVVVQARNNF